jgi:hypothetical protein
MTTPSIIINAITHRTSCTDALGADDLAAYDAAAPKFFEHLGAAARAAGFAFEVDACGQGAASYRIDGQLTHDEYQAAHEFMQSEQADFWQMYS